MFATSASRRAPAADRPQPGGAGPRHRHRRLVAVALVVATLAGVSVVRSVRVDAAAPAVIGAINGKWQALGAAGGVLGQPLEAERPTFDGVGRAQEFQYGTISWHPNIGAFSVIGDIRARWLRLGRESWGYPITDERRTPVDIRGRFNHFAVMEGMRSTTEVSIYWTPQHGAVEVYGAIREFWGKSGWERGRGIFPVEPERARDHGSPGRYQRFEGEPIIWTPSDGAAFRIPDITKPWEYRTGKELGTSRLKITEHGFWEFSGGAQNQFHEDKTVYVMCALRASSGQVFQWSASGKLKASGSSQFPQPGRPVMAGRDMSIAAAWPSISRGYQIHCKMGSDVNETTLFQDIKNALGIARDVVQVVSVVKGTFFPS